MAAFSPSMNKAVSILYPKELMQAWEIVHKLIYEMEASGKDANDYRDEVTSLPEPIRRELQITLRIIHEQNYRWKVNTIGVSIHDCPFLDQAKLRKIRDALTPVLPQIP